MAATDEHTPVRAVQDTRRSAHGWGRMLVAVFGVFGAVILFPSLVGLVRHPHDDPLMESFNIAGGLLYLLLAVCVAHNGRRMRNIGWMSLAALATMAVLIGVLSLSESQVGLEASVWAGGGRPLWYLPLILPVVAAAWMWMSDPRRIVVNAERMTELSDTLTERSRAAQEARQEARRGRQGKGGRPRA